MSNWIRRILTRASLVVLVFGMAVWPAEPAGFRCRSDPAVLLSDGTLIDLSADIEALPWEVVRVDYVMYVPSHLKVVAVIRTPTWLTTQETFTVVANQPRNTYDTSTVVKTRNRAAVTANVILKSLTNVIGLASVDGMDGQKIRVMIKARPLGLQL